MKLLWFATSPSNAAIEFGYTHAGCGWIASLETIIVESQQYKLGICFLYNGTEYKKIEKNNVVYYGIPNHKKNGLTRILDRQFGKLDDEFKSDLYDEILNDFKPDIIHVFGTENGYGKILVNKFDKVVFHLQGLVAPISKTYFPPVVTRKNVLLNDSMGNTIRGLTFFHSYNIFKKRVQREVEIIKHWKYFTGRTGYDRNYVKLLNPSAEYFHCEELLRSDFFSIEWAAPEIIHNNNRIKISIATTINPNVYKGLDVIYSVLPLLKNFDITWNIFGLTEDNNLNKVVKKTLKIMHRNESIYFHGQLNASELVTQLKKCHFFVHPSYSDNSPNSVCEAMLIGMPVLSSSVGGVKSLITNEENGFLFNPHDRYDLAGLIAYLTNNFGLAIEAGKKARKTALQRHDSAEIIRVLNNMYNYIISD